MNEGETFSTLPSFALSDIADNVLRRCAKQWVEIGSSRNGIALTYVSGVGFIGVVIGFTRVPRVTLIVPTE